MCLRACVRACVCLKGGWDAFAAISAPSAVPSHPSANPSPRNTSGTAASEVSAHSTALSSMSCVCTSHKLRKRGRPISPWRRPMSSPIVRRRHAANTRYPLGERWTPSTARSPSQAAAPASAMGLLQSLKLTVSAAHRPPPRRFPHAAEPGSLGLYIHVRSGGARAGGRKAHLLGYSKYSHWGRWAGGRRPPFQLVSTQSCTSAFTASAAAANSERRVSSRIGSASTAETTTRLPAMHHPA